MRQTEISHLDKAAVFSVPAACEFEKIPRHAEMRQVHQSLLQKHFRDSNHVSFSLSRLLPDKVNQEPTDLRVHSLFHSRYDVKL